MWDIDNIFRIWFIKRVWGDLCYEDFIVCDVIKLFFCDYNYILFGILWWLYGILYFFIVINVLELCDI